MGRPPDLSDNKIRRFELARKVSAKADVIKICFRPVRRAGERYGQIYEDSSAGKRKRRHGCFGRLPERAGGA